MKRSEFISGLEQVLYDAKEFDGHDMDPVIAYIEEHLVPKSYINPRAIKDFGDIIKEKGSHWGYIHYIDEYPEHHFLRGRPYEYYVEGWEPEDE